MDHEEVMQMAVLTVKTSKSSSSNPEIVRVDPIGGLSYVFCVIRLTMI